MLLVYIKVRSNSMINYLLSGIDKEKGFTEVQTKYLKKDIKKILISVLFVGCARHKMDFSQKCCMDEK